MRFNRSVSVRIVLLAWLVPLLAAAPVAAGAAVRGVPIHAGDSVASSISPAGDADTFVFDAYAGSALSVKLAPGKGSLLRPELAVLDPAGSALDLSPFAKTKKGKTTLKKLPLATTGRYAVVVTGVAASEGAYSLSTKLAPPKKFSRSEEIPAGGTIDVAIPGKTDVFAKVKIKGGDAGFEVVGVFDPEGAEIPGAKDAFVMKKKAATGTVALLGPLGDYTLRIGSADAATTVAVSGKAKYPKVKGRKLEISPFEPAITALSPAFGRPGDAVDIEGENFIEGDGLEVLFGDAPAPFVEWKSATLVRATAPTGEGEATVTVYNPDGQSGDSPEPFTFVPDPPTILTVVPNRGPDSGGTVLDIFGSDLDRVVEARLGGAAISTGFTLVDSGHIRLTTDAHSPGSATLVLEDQWGQTPSMFGAFTFYGPPEIEGLSPAGGAAGGGTKVTIDGAWLIEEDLVFFDGVPALSVTSAGYNQITATTPPHPVGRVDVRVEDPWGRSVTAEGAFTYEDSSFVDQTDEKAPENGAGLYYGGRTVSLGDLDGDGDRDLVLARVAGSESLKAFGLLNDGEGGFTDGRIFPKPAGTNGDAWDAQASALGDLDGDGDLDLVLTCSRLFQARSPVTYWFGQLAYTAYNLPYLATRVFVNDGKGGLVQKTDSFAGPGAKSGTDLLLADSLALGDVDGDDDLDLILTNHRSVLVSTFTSKIVGSTVLRNFSVGLDSNFPATRVMLNDGSGGFTDASVKALPSMKYGDMFAAQAILLGDVDGDADLDLVMTTDHWLSRDDSNPEFVKGSKTRILRNDGSGTFENVTATFMPEPSMDDDWGGVALTLGDLDGDSLEDDLAIALSRELTTGGGGDEEELELVTSTRVFEGSAKGFKDVTADWMPPVNENGSGDSWRADDIRFADPGGDGYADLFLVTIEPLSVTDGPEGTRLVSSLRWLGNAGEAPFTSRTAKSLPDPAERGDSFRGHALVFGDLDGDEDLDLVLTTELNEYMTSGARPTRLFELK